jgi:transcriptional antiterminator RfaH
MAPASNRGIIIMEQQWFAARHKAQQASWAILNLEHQGFATYFPTFPHKIVRHNKVRVVQQPIFPGYIFIRFSLSDHRYVAINSTSGVVRLLPTQCARPVALPGGFVETLQARDVTVPLIVETLEVFACNTVVRVLAGVFVDKLGTVLSSSVKSTRVELQAFGGRPTTVTVPTVDLIEVPPS